MIQSVCSYWSLAVCLCGGLHIVMSLKYVTKLGVPLFNSVAAEQPTAPSPLLSPLFLM